MIPELIDFNWHSHVWAIKCDWVKNWNWKLKSYYLYSRLQEIGTKHFILCLSFEALLLLIYSIIWNFSRVKHWQSFSFKIIIIYQNLHPFISVKVWNTTQKLWWHYNTIFPDWPSVFPRCQRSFRRFIKFFKWSSMPCPAPSKQSWPWSFKKGE